MNAKLKQVGLSAVTATYHTGKSTLAFSVDVVKTLGTRGGDGFPYLVKLMFAAIKIFEGFKISHSFALAIVVTGKALKPAVDLVGCLTSPFVDLAGVIESVQNAVSALQGKVEEKRKVEVKFVQADGSPLPAALQQAHPNLKGDRVHQQQASKGAIAMVVAQAFADLSIYFAGVCEAVSRLSSLEAIVLGDCVLAKVARVGGICATVFAVIGTAGSIVKVAVAAYKYCHASEGASQAELEQLKASAKVAVANLAKTAIKVAMMVFTAHFSLGVQGIAALVVVAIDIYVLKTKPQTAHKELVEVRMDVRAMTAATAGAAAAVAPALASALDELDAKPLAPAAQAASAVLPSTSRGDNASPAGHMPASPAAAEVTRWTSAPRGDSASPAGHSPGALPGASALLVQAAT